MAEPLLLVLPADSSDTPGSTRSLLDFVCLTGGTQEDLDVPLRRHYSETAGRSERDLDSMSAHLDQAAILCDARLGGVGFEEPRRVLRGYLSVVRLEIENMRTILSMTRATAISNEVPRYLEVATTAVASHRDVAGRMAAVNLADPGIFEQSQQLIRVADLIEEQAATMKRLSGAELRYMPLLGDRVFVIHGHSTDYHAARDLLTELGFRDRVTVLKEEPSRGQTILEKFLTHASQACMAIALVTPDDVVQATDEVYAQARPNVLFEIGWFIGRLGSDRVCILVRAGTPLPSDLAGVLTLEYTDDVQEVREQLEREIDAMGVRRSAE